MVISPTLLILSIKIRIILILFLSIFFFSKSLLTRTKIKNKLKTKIVSGIDMAINKGTKTLAFNPGPFMIKILKALALLSVISLISSLYSEFQKIKITFSFWLKKTPTKISLNILYDQYFLVFLAVALIVT